MTNVPIDMNTTCGRQSIVWKGLRQHCLKLARPGTGTQMSVTFTLFFPRVSFETFFLAPASLVKVGRALPAAVGRNGIDLPRQLVGDANPPLQWTGRDGLPPPEMCGARPPTDFSSLLFSQSQCMAHKLQHGRKGDAVPACKRLLGGVTCQRASAGSSYAGGSGPPALLPWPSGSSRRTQRRLAAVGHSSSTQCSAGQDLFTRSLEPRHCQGDSGYLSACNQ